MSVTAKTEPTHGLFMANTRMPVNSEHRRERSSRPGTARIHTPPETTVDVALAREHDRAIVTVTDDGPGIPENLRSTLFERFARGDSSPYRGTGSTGLGLAIARAVVAAHHGEIDVDGRPGFTSFRVSLPLT